MHNKILNTKKMFTYGDNYVGTQASSNCEDAVHSCIYFGKKCTWSKYDHCCANVCGFLSILMRVNFIKVPKIMFYQMSVYIWK